MSISRDNGGGLRRRRYRGSSVRREIVGMGSVGIGGDPGELAGGVAVHARGGWVVGSWQRRTSRGVHRWDARVVSLFDGVSRVDEWCSSSIAQIASDCVRLAAPMDLTIPVAIERITSHRGRTVGHTALAESAGSLQGGIWCGSGPAQLTVRRPMPSEWRGAVLGLLATTDAASCARSAIGAVRGQAVVGRRYTVDLGLQWPSEVDIDEHAAEAVCLAVYAAGGRLGEPVE